MIRNNNATVANVLIGCLLWTAVAAMAVLMSLRWMPSGPGLLLSMRWIPPQQKTFPAAAPTPTISAAPSPQREEDEPASAWEGFLRQMDVHGADERSVIFTAVNAAWAQPGGILNLFLRSQAARTDSVRRRLLIACLDAKALQLCSQMHWACFQLPTPGVDFSAETLYMTPPYVAMMWTRLRFVLNLLRRNYTILLTDTDVMWLRNPLQILEADRDADIQISCDNREKREANTGFIYVRANERSVAFLERWNLASKVFPMLKEQDVFNILTSSDRKMRGSNSNNSSSSMSMESVKIKYLDTNNFGGFCKRSSNISDAFTMHANCCKGLHAKIVDLERVLSAWDLYHSANYTSTNSSSRPLQWPPPVACRMSWYKN